MCDLSKRAASQDAPIRVLKREGVGRSGAAVAGTGRAAVRLTAEERKEIAEIVCLLAEKPRQFRLQFLSTDGGSYASVRDERSVWAIDASTAVGMAADVALPEGATRLRLVDPDGRTVFERQAEEALGA